MEQTTQQITQKPPFPIKTIIVGLLMLLIGSIGLIYSMILYNDLQNAEGCLLWAIIIPYIVGAGIVFFVPGLLILLKKRFGWWLATIIFSIGTVLVIISIFPDHIDDLPISLIPIIPLTLLLLDRKNFFKIAK